MDPREAIQQVLGTRPLVAVDVEDDEEEPIGELEVAEYVIFVLALDTYMRYVEEATGNDDPDDPVIRRGIKLLRIADAELDRVRAFLDEHLPSEGHKRLLAKAVRRMGYSPAMAAQRALMLRTALSRGGAKTMRAVFQTNRALREIRAAIAASMMDDADAALDLFAGLPMRNARLRAWIDLAARTAGSGETPQNPIEAGAKVVADQGPELLKQAAQEMGAPAAEDTKKAIEVQTARITQVQADATQAAKKSMEVSGEPDLPLIKSEVVGVAVAAATAAASDPSKPQNVPATLIDVANDPEQLAAALTDGRVLVAAGAGAGKSRTLTSRVSYLVQERGVDPGRVLVTSFNRVAANKLGKDIADRVGESTASLMTIGTMHSLFGKFIRENGTEEERIGMTFPQQGGGQIGDGSIVGRVVQKLWEACFDPKLRPTPKFGDMMRQRDLWAGNDVSLEDAKGLVAEDPALQDAADWYEMYEGLKGAIPGWEPPCEEKVRDAAERKSRGRRRKDTPFERFMAKHRPGGRRLGDFNDMIRWCADIMERDPGARQKLQKRFDHILIDECQDLNSTQHRAFKLMSEHIDEDKGQSLWLVGDDKQAIYEFAGARPDLFISLHDKEGWNTRMIRTNYRSTPEIIEPANRLIAHNQNQIPMEANPAPGRVRGTGSVRVTAPVDEAEAALGVVEDIKARAVEIPDENPPGTEDDPLGGPGSYTPRQKYYADNAVLTRTNAELHAYETACIIRGIPYARRGAGSFLGSPETSAFLGYVQLATGTDFAKMQKALGNVLHRPNRFWKNPKDGVKHVEKAMADYAYQVDVDPKTLNPVTAFNDEDFRRSLTKSVLGRDRYRGKDFQYDKTVEELQELGRSLQMMRANVREEGFSTEDLFNMVFELRGKTSKTDSETGEVRFTDQSFRESLEVELRDRSGDDEDAAEADDDATKGMGNITFLYELMKVDPTDEDDMKNDPALPMGFQDKMSRLAAKMRDLRIDFGKWAKKHPGVNPPAVLLSTVHRVKGDQWETVFAQMPKGKFPIMRARRANEPAPNAEKEEQRIESERRLGYVALTRAKKNLTVVCPRTIGGKEAGISPFVEEAQLALGENVSKTAPETTEETV